MHKIIRKLALTVSLLLVLSQWLSFAHATEHLISVHDSECQICTLHHHFHSATLDAKPGVTLKTDEEFAGTTVYNLYANTTPANKSIRGPPQ